MKKEEIYSILQLHKEWLLDNTKGKRAVLRRAVLRRADLTDAVLTDAVLRRADLTDAVLTGAVLTGAVLTGAVLTGAVLRYADLTGADLRCADLRYADLTGAVLRYADLTGADLRCADLTGADLRYADLTGVKTNGSTVFFEMSCPSDGAFIAWKKVDDKLIKLLVPEDAKRSSATSYKCRCDKAKVIDITDLNEKEHYELVVNTNYNILTTYKVGEYVYPDKFDDDRWNECSHGIHFFINKNHAINY